MTISIDCRVFRRLLAPGLFFKYHLGFVCMATLFSAILSSMEYEVLLLLIDVSGRTGNIVLSSTSPLPPSPFLSSRPRTLYF